MGTIANFSGGGLCLLLACLMLRFKTVELIAGYNTASREEQEKYDTDKLARYVGLMLLYMGASLVLGGAMYLAVRQIWLLLASWAVFLILCLGGVIYLNVSKCCYKDEYR